MDFAQSLDPSKLVLAGTGLSLLISLAQSPTYNLPIFLFGCYVTEAPEASQSLQIFTGLLSVSTLFDIVWFIKNNQHGFFRFLSVLLLLLKLPTLLAFVTSLRQRGAQFGGLGSNTLGGPTVWSMPGGFTSNGREGYQTVDDDAFIRNVRPAPSIPHKNTPVPEPTVAPGAYQTV